MTIFSGLVTLLWIGLLLPRFRSLGLLLRRSEELLRGACSVMSWDMNIQC